MLVLFLAGLATLQFGKQAVFASDSGVDISQAEPTPERVTRIRSGGIRFSVFQIVRLDSYKELSPANATFLIVTGSLESEEPRCVYADDFRVAIGNVEYTPVIPVMERIQPAMRDRQFPGTALLAQCILGSAEVPMYVVYDLPLSETAAMLRFFDREGLIGDLNLLEVVNDTDESMLRSVVGEPHRLRRNSNVRACAGTTCEIVHIFRRDETAIKVGETFGMEVRGSQLWFEVLLDDGTRGYVHSSLMRRINP
jgi:hypothetical protein